MDLRRTLGFNRLDPQDVRDAASRRLLRYLDLRLMASGFPSSSADADTGFTEVARGLIESHQEQKRLLRDHRCPADQRIEDYLKSYFLDLGLDHALRLPSQTFTLDLHGMSRELSLPAGEDEYHSPYVDSYRVYNGVLNNPVHDRRTTKGTFHVCDGGLPVADDKLIVPKAVFAGLFQRAMKPPQALLELPYTSKQKQKAYCFVSLLLRPLVSPAVPGYTPEKTLETRFFVPGSLVSNLDFVESIFGNAGDPGLPANDAGLDVEHWTGHTGCVILAPHLTQVLKKDLGLPQWDDATERQQRDGMCWKAEDELYNGGSAFKLTCRNEEGVIVTLIADNYFGYCKKEVKTQISYAANLYGACEEEHAGGALAFAGSNLGDEFQVDTRAANGRTFTDVVVDYADDMELFEAGYGVDKQFPNVIYIPDNAKASLREQTVSWTRGESTHSIPLLPNKVYIAPSGYKLRIEKHPAAPSWRLIGVAAEGVSCHKPCTVSGGGKSEISKSVGDYMLYGPIFVADSAKDLALVDEIFRKDYAKRWKPDSPHGKVYETRKSRPLLDPNRSVGSMIKSLTPSTDYNDGFNEWLASIPNHVYAIALIIKRFYSPDWGDNWHHKFSVDIINGEPGYELKFGDRKLVGTYLRVGLLEDNTWRTFKVRQDFYAADKIQTEDDITGSVVAPGRFLEGRGGPSNHERSYKFISNCEYRLFQRPDDAVHRGLDKQTELDLSQPGNFISNFEPLHKDAVEALTQRIVDFDSFSVPMKQMLRNAKESGSEYVVCSSIPRNMNGTPSKNPRYLQDRPDIVNPMARYVAERGVRLYRGTPANEPLHLPVDAVLMGRRNNPPDKKLGIRSLAVYGPIHYQERPELFRDLIVSLTGKSPSTTGFGSEGALTKGPFNALTYAADLNAALVSSVLTQLDSYSTSAGYVGPNVAVGHDISLLIPELWCRMSAEERSADWLIAEGLLEPVADYELNGETAPASRLGYRINSQFVRRFFGRIFDNPDKIFDEALLCPETQDPESYFDGVNYIVGAQKTTALHYFADGSVEQLCPPLKALVTIMAHGEFEGKTEKDPAIRAMFTRERILNSDWYRERLETKQTRDRQLWHRHLEYVDRFRAEISDSALDAELHLGKRANYAQEQLRRVSATTYIDELRGSLGADPLLPAGSPA
jgi:hypothetical protein